MLRIESQQCHYDNQYWPNKKKEGIYIMKGFSYFIKALQIMGIVSGWSVKALEDGKITMAEGYKLLFELCEALGVDTEIEVPPEYAQP